MDRKPELKNIQVNCGELNRLIDNLHTLTGIWMNIFDNQGRPVQVHDSNNRFCRAVGSTAEGAARCKACDLRAVQACCAAGNPNMYSYTCHAGLKGYLFPVFEEGDPIAYLAFSDLREDVSRNQQWERIRQSLDWFSGDLEQVMQGFFQMKQCTPAEITAFAELLQVLVRHIQREGLIYAVEYTDRQKLEMYLDAHYMEPLSLQSISNALHMGTTKLCSLARQISDGSTVTQLIAVRRVRAAEKLLISSSCPISDVAGRVGFSDYNYFTRIFKANTGMTPRNFRKLHQQPPLPSA